MDDYEFHIGDHVTFISMPETIGTIIDVDEEWITVDWGEVGDRHRPENLVSVDDCEIPL